MGYIVFDLEYNQPFEIDSGTRELKSGKVKHHLPNEIIQIGAMQTDLNFNIQDKFVINIRPNIYKKIHPVVKKITNITNRQLEFSCRFDKALQQFKKWMGKRNILCCWGKDDIVNLIRNCNCYKIDTGWIKQYIDLQDNISKQIFNSKDRIGLREICDFYNIIYDKNNFHNACYDAKLTTFVAMKADVNLQVNAIDKIMDDFKNEKKEIEQRKKLQKNRQNYNKLRQQSKQICHFPVHHKMVHYYTINDIRCNIRCSKCGKFVQNRYGWYKVDNKYVFALGKCNICNLFVYCEINFKFKYSLYSVTSYMISKDLYSNLIERIKLGGCTKIKSLKLEGKINR